MKPNGLVFESKVKSVAVMATLYECSLIKNSVNPIRHKPLGQFSLAGN